MRWIPTLLLPAALLMAGCASSTKTLPFYIGPHERIPPTPPITSNPDCRRYTLDISRRPIVCALISRTAIILDGENTRYDVYQALENTVDEAGHIIVPANSLFYGVENSTTGESVAICRFFEFGQKDWTLAQGVTPSDAIKGDRVSLYLSFLSVPILTTK
jgi:hypothetical protein